MANIPRNALAAVIRLSNEMLAAVAAADWSRVGELDRARRDQIHALTSAEGAAEPAELEHARRLDRELLQTLNAAREGVKADLTHLQHGQKAVQAYSGER